MQIPGHQSRLSGRLDRGVDLLAMMDCFVLFTASLFSGDRTASAWSLAGWWWKMLSVDVCSCLPWSSLFAVPLRYQHKMLFYSVIGAMMFRGIYRHGRRVDSLVSQILFGIFQICTQC
jgi:hypothetical protein